jgi:hypothetical protein
MKKTQMASKVRNDQNTLLFPASDASKTGLLSVDKPNMYYFLPPEMTSI